MSATRTVIGELDVVELIVRVERWPAGTKGTVQHDHGDSMTVEITGIEESEDDMLEYLPVIATEDLRLVWKWPGEAS